MRTAAVIRRATEAKQKTSLPSIQEQEEVKPQVELANKMIGQSKVQAIELTAAQNRKQELERIKLQNNELKKQIAALKSL